MTGGLRNILLPFSLLYGGVVSIRNFGYDSSIFKAKRLPVPVISVGNITVGGSGKTPFAMFLIEKILSLGKRPAVLSRGYKRLTDKLVIACPEKGSEVDVQMIGDEPALISQSFPDVPVAVHRDRHHAGLSVLRTFGADVFILDDGLQSRELYRDIDFVLIRSSLYDLRDEYLPAGNLRDSRRRIGQSDVIVVSAHHSFDREEIDLGLISHFSDAPVTGISFVPSHLVDHGGSTHSVDMLEKRGVSAFCGIANPEQFFTSVRNLKAKLASQKSFRDHHWYDEYDIDEIFGGDEELIAVTTPKDATRIFCDEELSQKEEVKRIYALHEKAVVNFGEEHIDSILVRIFGGANA